MRIIRLEPKTVIMKLKGSSSLYAAIKRLIPKTRKKEATSTSRHWPTHHNNCGMISEEIIKFHGDADKLGGELYTKIQHQKSVSVQF